MNAKRLTSLLLILAMLLALAACGNGSNSTPEETNSVSSGDTSAEPIASEPQYGGDLVVYFQEFYNEYDPSMADIDNYALWYEPLFGIDWSRDDTGEIYTTGYMTMEYMTGQIAESYTFEDGVLTVQIRDDVYFQDKEPYNGRQLVAEDVKWSYDRLLGIGSGYDTPYECTTDWVGTLYMLDSIETDGDFTVIFHFNTSSELALDAFITSQVMIGGHEWDELTDEQKSDWHYAAGTGPYILTEYEPDNYMKLTRNENYYDYDERYPENQLPYLDSITLQLVSDSTTAQTQFMSGNLDIIAWGGNVLTSTEAELLQETMNPEDYVMYTYVGSPTGIALKQTHEALSDVRVRTALQMAVNSEEIYHDYFDYDTDDLNICGAWALETLYSSVDEWDQELYDSYTVYDPEGAKELLAEAGYPDGFSFDVVIFEALDADLFTLTASYLSQIGVTMNVSVATSPLEMQQQGKDLTNEISIFGSGGATNIAGIARYYTIDGSENSTGYNDPEFEAMLDSFNACETLDEAIEIGKQIDEYWAEQHLCLYMGGAELFNCFISGRIQGYSGERLWKNWNSTQILARIWVDDAN